MDLPPALAGLLEEFVREIQPVAGVFDYLEPSAGLVTEHAASMSAVGYCVGRYFTRIPKPLSHSYHTLAFTCSSPAASPSTQ
jgi:hypothetical protein